MSKLPLVEIQYLPQTEVTASSTTLGDLGGLDNIEDVKTGKKGLFLSGGEIDSVTGKDSGTLLNGKYTLFAPIDKYPAFIGNTYSDSNYEFTTTQEIIITAKTGTYINSLIIYFDTVAEEYATKITLSDAPSTQIENNSYTFVRTFTPDTYTSITITFDEWSKKNSFAKVLRIVSGLSKIYNITEIKNLTFSNEFKPDIEIPEYGLSSQYGNVSIFDKDYTIKELVNSGIIQEEITISIYFQGERVGTYKNKKLNNLGGQNIWKFEFEDNLKRKQEEWFTGIGVASRTLYEIVNILEPNILWESDSDTFAQLVIIPNSFLVASSKWSALYKCCQIGLMRIYKNANGDTSIRRIV